MKFGINKIRTFLPLSVSKGTTEQRLQKARDFNLKFFKDLQYEIENREIKPAAFKRTLKENSSPEIGIKLLESTDSNIRLSSSTTTKCKINGYSFYFPLTFFSKNIRQSMEQSFLAETQSFFNHIFNPKFLTREISIINKGYHTEQLRPFYAENITGTKVLKKEVLNDLLKGKKPAERIDYLQALRYKLLDEMNTRKAEFQIDKLIEKFENIKFLNKNYDLTPYRYEEKMTLLNTRLKQSIQEARESVKTGLTKKMEKRTK